jgi:CRISPR/Cas system-associated exonuclease Cas4 (RecB family)
VKKAITSWSFSRYSVYKQCPLKLKLSVIDRIREPGNEAMARGDSIHKSAEAYIKGWVRALPPELKLFKDEFKRLRAQYKRNSVVVEDTWSFTKDWTETRWDDWAGCWVRVKLDCAHYEDDETLIITDWKTGKFRPEMNEEYTEQLELYALAALLRYEGVKQVKPRLVYLDLGVTYPEEPLVYTRDDVPKLKRLWEKRTKAMLNDKRFAPRPSDKCRWCFYRRSNKAQGGGQCEY